MRIPLALVLLTSAAALAGCMGDQRHAAGADTDAGLARVLAGRVPGKQTSCLPPGRSNGNTKSYGKTLLYTFANGDMYANDTTGGCEDRGNSIAVSIEHEGRACSGDMVRLIDRASRIPTGACALGQFTPYLKPRR